MANTCQTFFISGKGGVGKSVVATALALDRATQGRTLLVELALESLWSTSYEPRLLQGQLYACRLTREDCLREYVYRKVRIKTLANLLLNHSPLASFFQTAPGVEGIVLMGKIFDLARSGEFSSIIVDAPATGHGLGLFQTVGIVRSLFRVGPLHDDAAEVGAWVKSPSTGVKLVTLLEELPVQETLEFRRGLQELGLRVDEVIVNRYPSFLPPLPTEEQLRSLTALPEATPSWEHLALSQRRSTDRHTESLRRSMSDIALSTLPEALEFRMELALLASLWTKKASL